MKTTPLVMAVLFLFVSLHANAIDNTAIDNAASDNATNTNVVRALFTSDIKDREPVDEIGQLGNNIPQIFFFTEITGMPGQTITHRWQHKGKVEATIKLKIGGERWRAWSSKKLLPGWVGVWTVTVLDANGNILAEEDMAYIPPRPTNLPVTEQ